MAIPQFLSTFFSRSTASNAMTADTKRACEGEVAKLIGNLIANQPQLNQCRNDHDALVQGVQGTIDKFAGLAALDWIYQNSEEIAPLLNSELSKLSVRDRDALASAISVFLKDGRATLLQCATVNQGATEVELRKAQAAVDLGKALRLVDRQIREMALQESAPVSHPFVVNRYVESLKEFLHYGILSESNKSDADLTVKLRNLVNVGPSDLSSRSEAEDESYQQAIKDCIAKLDSASLAQLKVWFSLEQGNAVRISGLLNKNAHIAQRELAIIAGYVDEMTAGPAISPKVRDEFVARARTLVQLANNLKSVAQAFHGNYSTSVSQAAWARLIHACGEVENKQQDWASLFPGGPSAGNPGNHAEAFASLVQRLRLLAEHHQWSGADATDMTRLADELCYQLDAMLPAAQRVWEESHMVPTNEFAHPGEASNAAAPPTTKSLKPYLEAMREAVAEGVATHRARAHEHTELMVQELAALPANSAVKGRKLDQIIGRLRVLSNESLISGTQPGELADLHPALANMVINNAYGFTDSQLSELSECKGLALPLDRIASRIRGMRSALNACVNARTEAELTRGAIELCNHAQNFHNTLTNACPSSFQAGRSLPTLIGDGMKLVVERAGRAQRQNLQRLIHGSVFHHAIYALPSAVQNDVVSLQSWKDGTLSEDMLVQAEKGLGRAVSLWANALQGLSVLLDARKAPSSVVPSTDEVEEFIWKHFGLRLGTEGQPGAVALKNVEINLHADNSDGGIRRAVISLNEETHNDESNFIALMMDKRSLDTDTREFTVAGSENGETIVTANKQFALDLDRLDVTVGNITLKRGEAHKEPEKVSALMQQLAQICPDAEKRWFYSGLLNQTIWGRTIAAPPNTRCDWILHGADAFGTKDAAAPEELDTGPKIRYGNDPEALASSLNLETSESGKDILLRSNIRMKLLSILPFATAGSSSAVGLDSMHSRWNFSLALKVPDENSLQEDMMDPKGATLNFVERVMLIEEPYTPVKVAAMPNSLNG